MFVAEDASHLIFVGRVYYERWYLHGSNMYQQSVAKCRGSWVVGRGRGSWVWAWVNVVGKKNFSKIKKAKSCKIHATKISVYMLVLLPFPAVSKANKGTI